MDEYLKNLRDRKGKAWESYKALVHGAAAENRDLTAEEVEQRERIDVDLDNLHAEEKRYADRLAEMDTADAIRAAIAPVIETPQKAAELSFRDRISQPGGAAFELRALGNTPDGGSAVPEAFASKFTAYQRTMNPTEDVATVYETPGNNGVLTFPRLTADPAYGGTITAEGGGIVATDPTLSSVDLVTYKYATITLVSAELWRSNVIDLPEIIARSAGRELGLDIGTHLTTGDGSSKPNGFITAATNGGTASGTASALAGATFVGGGDVIDLYMALAAPYRAVGTWQASTDMVTKIRSFADSNGHPIYNPLGEGLNPGINGTLLGRPMVENPAMASPASASKSLAFGDFSAYVVRSLPIRVDVSTDFKFQNDQIAVRVVREVDGDLIDTAAVAYIVSANT